MVASYTVLELASVLAGPSVGQFFAELGATVIKVENPRTQGDVTRRWTLPHETLRDDRSAYFCCCNYGKQSLALDLRAERGQAVLHRLAAESDIVIANYRPGQAQALGADPDTLRAQNPALVYGHITGYGPDNPRPGYDAVVQAKSGFMAMNGYADGPPTKMPVALMDVLAAHHLKEALLIALLRRTQTGTGAYVPVSLMQAAASGLANQATNYLHTGHVPQRMGSAHPNIAPYGTAYETADTPVVLAVGTDRQFEALCTILQCPALAHEARFATNRARVRHRTALDEALRPKLAVQPAAALLQALHEHGVPAGAVRTMPAVLSDPHVAPMTLGTREEEDEAGVPGLRQVAPETAGSSGKDLTPPPRYAADTAAVLRAYGYARASIKAMENSGIIQTASASR